MAEQSPAREAAEGAIADFAAERVPLMILTGMSGAGRSTAAKVLEDLGWYVVDNLPPQMLDHLQQLRQEAAASNPDELLRLAVVIDARTRTLSDEFTAVVGAMRAGADRPVLVFFDATDEDLVRRFEGVRRPHPLQGSGRLLDGITAERELVAELRSNADLLVDTSGLNVHQLTAKVTSLVDSTTESRIRVAVMSFGFKYGVPLDADFVFDMRFLPNPFWVPELRPLTGRDAAVADYVMGKQGDPQLHRPGGRHDGTGLRRLPLGGPSVRDGRRGLHRRQAPLGGGGRAPVRAAAQRPRRHLHRPPRPGARMRLSDLGRE